MTERLIIRRAKQARWSLIEYCASFSNCVYQILDTQHISSFVEVLYKLASIGIFFLWKLSISRGCYYVCYTKSLFEEGRTLIYYGTASMDLVFYLYTRSTLTCFFYFFLINVGTLVLLSSFDIDERDNLQVVTLHCVCLHCNNEPPLTWFFRISSRFLDDYIILSQRRVSSKSVVF